MANGKSQTDPVGSGDETKQDTTTTQSTGNLEDIRQSKSKKSSIPEQVYEDSGMIQFLQNLHPKYKGWNVASLRSEILKNNKVLDEFANRILSDSMEMNESLTQTYENDPSIYQEHKQRVKDTIERRLSTDVLKGETAKQSIVNRTLEIRKNDISGFKPQKQEFEHEGLVKEEARKHGLDPDFVMSVIEQESGFKHNDPDGPKGVSESGAGALGYMQLMPDTADSLGVDPYDPEDNIRGGVKYLADQIKEFGSIEMGLAAYNAGPTRTREAGGVPQIEETQNYVRSIVGNYQQRKGQGFDYNAPVADYKRIAEENPDKYRELGIVDSEGKFKYEGEGSIKTFKSKLLENDKLHKELSSDRFELFREELADSHNSGAIDESDIDDTARAWSIYDQFGSEGLTQYLNVDSKYQEGVPLEEQPQSVRDGVEYLKNASQDGFKPADYVKTFFGKEDSSIGRFEVTPVTQSREMQENVKKDLNNWTSEFHNTENPEQGISNILRHSRKRQEDEEETFVESHPIPFGKTEGLQNVEKAYVDDGLGAAVKQAGIETFSAVSEAFGGAFGVFSPLHQPDNRGFMDENGNIRSPREGEDVPSLLDRLLFGEGSLEERVYDTDEDFDKTKTTYEEATNAQIAEDLQDGVDSRWSRAAKIDILREAQSEDGAFNVSDLARTIMANQDEYIEKDGNAVYKIDYDSASPRTKVAIDALRFDEGLSKSFYRMDDGTLAFEPNYLNRVKDKAIPKYATSIAWEKKVVTDQEGNPVGYREVQGEQDSWESLANTLTAFGYQGTKFLDDHMVKPMVEKGLMPLMDEAADTFDAPEIREAKNAIQAQYQDSWRENLDTSITAEMDYNGPSDLLPTATAWGTPFGLYLAAASRIGKAGLKTPSKFFSNARKIRHKGSMEAASAFLKPNNYTKMRLATQKLAKSARKSQRWNEYGKFALGATPLEAAGGDQWSIFGRGLVDMINKQVLDTETDLQRRYQTAERATQIGMDIVGTEGIALLADNLLLGLGKQGGGYLKKWLTGKKSTGRTFVDEATGFQKVSKPEFASESARFYHNMFNGLQKEAIGEVPESMANRYTGRAFVENPANVQSLADAVTRFTEESGELFANAKSTIRSTIEKYDEQFGGDIRMTQEGINQSTDRVYNEFLDKTAENMKGFLEATSDDETLPFKVANLLSDQAARFKGQVPYITENGPRHLMTRAQANDLASESYRYVVKPAGGGDYARVFEIEDGLWTTELANRIKTKYTETSPDEIVARHAEAKGLGARAQFGPNDAEMDEYQTIVNNVRDVYGQEVEVDGLRGHIIDFDKNGFVIKDSEGQVHKGVKIETLDDLIQENLGASQFTDQLDDVIDGGKAVLTGRQVDDVNRASLRPDQMDYFGLTGDARNLLRNLDQEQTTPAFLSDNLKNIARKNGVDVKDGDSPLDVVNRLRKKGFSSKHRKQLEDLTRADELMQLFKGHKGSTRNVKGTGDAMQQRTGLTKPFMDWINDFAGYTNKSASTARKFAKLLGVDNTDGIQNMVKNVKDITRWSPRKVSDDGINANRGFLYNRGGTDEHFINVKKVYPEDTPRVWDFDENGRLVFSEKWRRIEPNQTVTKDNELPLYTTDEIDGTTWYRPAEPGEEGVFINVQNPTKNANVTKKEVYNQGIDAVEKEINGIKHYQLVNEGQQSIDPTKIKKRRAKIYNTNTTVKSPSKKQVDEVKKEATEEVAGKLEQAGITRSVAYGMGGALVDNMVGTAPGDDEDFGLGLFTVIGALMGSRRFRTKADNFINGFTSKPSKNIFDNSASATHKVSQNIENAKEREAYGFFVNENNDKTIQMANDVISELKDLGDRSLARWEDFRKSRFTESSFMYLSRLDNPVADNLVRGLERINETVNQIASIPRRNFAARVKSLRTQGRIPEGIYDNVADAYDTFAKERGPQIVKDIFPNREMSDAQAREQLELAVFRNRFGKTRLEEGELKWQSNPTTTRMYEGENGDLYRQLDRQLLRDPEFNEFMEANSTWFDTVKDEWMRQIDRRIDQRIDLMRADDTFSRYDVELMENLKNSDQTYGFWKQNLSDEDAQRMTAMKKNKDIVERLIGFHNRRQKFTNLEEGYYPQMISSTRTQTAFRSFVDDNDLRHLSEQEQKEAFDEYYTRQMYEMNADPKARRRLQKYDADGQKYGTYYGTKGEIDSELDGLIENLTNNAERQDLATRVASNRDEFIKTERVKQYDDQGNIRLDENGDPITEKRYFLETPENFEVNPFEVQGTELKNNIAQFRRFYNDLMQGNVVRESNFLERPRVKYIPEEFLEINLDTVRRRYSTDVGRRIHDARYNMFDEKELWDNYLNDIFNYAKNEQGAGSEVIKDMEDRIISIYNYAHNNLNKTGRDLRKEAKWKRVVDTFKNALFARFGYGFSWYNTFEHMVVGSHISSFDKVKGTIKLFSQNKQALENTESLLRTWDIVRREIGSVNPDFERFGTTEGNMKGVWQNRMNKVANFSADFSVAKDVGGNIFGWDVKDWGMARINPLFGDGFIGTNFVSSSINAQAALAEARHLADIAQQLEQLPRGNRVAQIDGKTWTIGEVRRKLSTLGINEDRYDRFIQNKDRFSNLVDQIRGEEELDLSEVAKAKMPQHVNDVFNIMQRATESFHGTNKLYRPESWHSPVGKALSTYSTYPFNFAMQTVQRRIRQPIKNWWKQYGREQLGEEPRTINTMKVLWDLKNGDIDKLRARGLSDEAIENIPVDAYRSVLKHFQTLGIGTAGYLTMDAVDDVITYPMNDATGAEQWENLERWKVLNPSAPKGDQVTWGDIDDDIGIENFMNIMNYGLGLAARGSMFGRYGDLIQSRYFLSRDGIMSLTPMTDMVNSSFKGAMDMARKPVSDWPQEMSNKGMRLLINNTPLLGSAVFGELRKGAYEQVRFKNRDDERGEPRFQSEETGDIMTIDDIRTELE